LLPATVGDHTLEKAPIVDFGYLTVETDGKNIAIGSRPRRTVWQYGIRYPWT
jgi:hypothetical protein